MWKKPNRGVVTAWLGLVTGLVALGPCEARAQSGAVDLPSGSGRPGGLSGPSRSTLQDGTITFQGAVGGGVVATANGPIYYAVPVFGFYGVRGVPGHTLGGFPIYGYPGLTRPGGLGVWRGNALYPNILNPSPSPPIQFYRTSGPANTGADLEPGEADALTRVGLRLGLGEGEKARELCVEAINAGAGADAQRMLALALAIEGRYDEAAAVSRSALSDPAVAGRRPPEVCATNTAEARRVSEGARRHARLSGSGSAWLLAIDVARATGTTFDAARWIEAAEDNGLSGDIAEALRRALGV